jgi:gluconokinase
MECIITIDIGTSATRIVAYDLKGNEIAYRKGSYPTFHPHSGCSEQDPEQVFITVLFLLKGILNEEIFPKKYVVTGIVFSSTMHSILPIDINGIPLGNAIIWSDNRALEIAADIKQSAIGQALYEHTGTPIHAMTPLSKVIWIKKHQPDKFEKTSKFISLKEYVIYQLTGEFIIDYSLASATGLFNIDEYKWDEDALKLAEVNDTYFSRLVDVCYSDFSLKENFVKSLGLKENVTLIIGSTDGCLATLSSGDLNQSNLTLSISSSSAVRTICKSKWNDKKGRFFNYVLDKDYYVNGGPSSNGGVAYEWVVNNFGKYSSMEVDERNQRLQAEARTVKEGADGLIFLPYIQGERAPIWNSYAKGTYFGLNIMHEPKHFIRSTIEGIIFETLSIAKAFNEYQSIDKITMNGSYAKDAMWAQITADIFSKTVILSKSNFSPNLGAAMVGMKSLGIFKNLEEACKIVSPGHELFPNSSKRHTYSQTFKIFESLTEKLKDEFEAISKLQLE